MGLCVVLCIAELIVAAGVCLVLERLFRGLHSQHVRGIFPQVLCLTGGSVQVVEAAHQSTDRDSGPTYGTPIS